MNGKNRIYVFLIFIGLSFTRTEIEQNLCDYFRNNIFDLENEIKKMQQLLHNSDLKKEKIRNQIIECRNKLKHIDIFLRYSEPVLYRKINGPLEVEWETEVFEKHEKPYRREGKGFFLIQEGLNETQPDFKKIREWAKDLDKDLKKYLHDTIIIEINKPEYFPFAARLFILNLLTLYTTGFENADEGRILPELKISLTEFKKQVQLYEQTTGLHYLPEFHSLVENSIKWLGNHNNYENFDHYGFIKRFVVPLFSLNQVFIQSHQLKSKQLIDYSLNNHSKSIFSKNLYYAQNTKGIFSSVTKKEDLDKIYQFGEMLFADPILSGNNKRSCSSCHRPDQFFTDNSRSSALNFTQTGFLSRNSPDLMGAPFQHLIMWDGRHLDLMEQFLSVIQNKEEMNARIQDVMNKILSCPE
ncbi:MAG: cytochrome-c peroxidase [Bacteroidia bacterium]|nr:cytochrome-c peroxidase [Bacteroidia bacterium]